MTKRSWVILAAIALVAIGVGAREPVVAQQDAQIGRYQLVSGRIVQKDHDGVRDTLHETVFRIDTTTGATWYLYSYFGKDAAGEGWVRIADPKPNPAEPGAGRKDGSRP